MALLADCIRVVWRMKTNMQEKELLINLLKSLNNIDYHKDSGICNQVLHGVYSDEYTFRLRFLRKCFVKWPDYSGDAAYPVKNPSTLLFKTRHPFTNTPSKAYKRLNCWKGEYGESRERLLTFIKNEVRVSINGGGE